MANVPPPIVADNPAGQPPTFTVRNAMILCGVPDVIFWNGMTQAERIASELFDDDFQICMDIKLEDVRSGLKTLAELRVAEGRCSVLPGARRKINAFIQWTRDQIRNGRNPSNFPFPVAESRKYLDRLVTHTKFIDESEHANKPQLFTNDMKWSDWAPTFVGFLAQIPGRNGVGLDYVVRENPNSDPTPRQNFLEEYVAMAPLHGPAFVNDSKKVLDYLNQFIVGHDVAEGAAEPVRATNDGRIVFQAIEGKFEGTGVLQNKRAKAETMIDTLYYTGENKYMPWEKFETEITKAYAIVDRAEGRQVHSDEMKLRKLQKDRIRADFLKVNHSTIEARCAEIPMTMTFDTAISVYRNAVQGKFPQGRTGTNSSGRRQAAEINRNRSNNQGNDGNRGNFHGGHGRGGGQRNRNGGGRGSGRPRNHPDQETIVLQNGQHIKYHPSYNFTPDEMRNMTSGQRNRLTRERQEYRERNGRGGRLTNRERDSQIAELRSVVSSLRGDRTNRGDGDSNHEDVPDQVETETVNQSQISQVSIGSSGSGMGGRNRQARRRLQAPR